MNEKETRLVEFCRENQVDGVYLRRRSNIAWLTDGADIHIDTGSPLGIASILWTRARRVVFTDTIESPRLLAEEFTEGWEFRTRDWWEPESGPAAAPGDASSGSKRGEGVPRPVLDELGPGPARVARDHPADQIAPLRYRLTPVEIERARQLGRQAARILGDCLRTIPRGSTEHELAGEVGGRLRKDGIHCPVLLVAADDRIARFRHPIPTQRRIERAAMCAICAQHKGLIVSLTRLVHFGPLPADLRRRHDAVCRVDATLHSGTIPGRRWCDVFAEAQRTYAQTGFADEWKKHHQGGPMGYELRDFKATPTEMRTVQPSQLVGWNPSITGTKSEDTIISGGEVITIDPDWPEGPGSRPEILVR